MHPLLIYLALALPASAFKSAQSAQSASSTACLGCEQLGANISSLTWTEGAVRMNQIQVVGTHNSYHIEPPPDELEKLLYISEEAMRFQYSHPSLESQLEYQHVRGLELDLLADEKGGAYSWPLIRRSAGLPDLQDSSLAVSGAKVLHLPDVDYHSVCSTLVSCLRMVKGWMEAHPRSVPLTAMVELKTADKRVEMLGGAKTTAWDRRLLDSLDAEIRSVFGSHQLITPDDIRREGETLEASVLARGWPDLDSARGRIMFLMCNGPDQMVRGEYNKDRPSLEGRVLFTNAVPGDPDCAFQKLDDPIKRTVSYIQEQVKAGYWVRTRADEPVVTVRESCNTTRRDLALESGAHMVSTDFPAYGMSARWGCSYAVRLPGGGAARCNPVNGQGCAEDDLEPGEYVQN